ncbi:MAG: TolC family protein [Vicinamibacterales bacterium]
MIRRLFALTLMTAVSLTAATAAAQEPLTLAEALTRAAADNADLRVAAAAEEEAQARLRQSRAGLLPSLDLSESWQRGNQPVFVFGSLLAQRAFGADDFALEALNRPDPVGNFRTALSVDAPLYDPAALAGRRAATVGRDLASAERRLVGHDLAVAVTAAYGDVLTAVATRQVLAAALQSAAADLERAGNRRDVGLATDADVLQVELHAAATRERELTAAADETAARARLNQLIGAPLDSVFALDDGPDAPIDTSSLAALEQAALADRVEVRVAALHGEQADAAAAAARAGFLPRVSALGTWEANGGAWASRASSWTVGAMARINLFRGFQDQARAAEARALQTRRAAERERTETAVRVDVRVAAARLEAARASLAVGQAAVAQARESQRIVRDRYENGLADVTALLRAAEGLQDADARHAAARVAVRVATATLARAVGR